MCSASLFTRKNFARALVWRMWAGRPAKPCYIVRFRDRRDRVLETEMPNVRFLLMGLTMLGLVACATKPPEPVVDYAPDYDFGQTKTIGFYALSGEVTGNSPSNLTDFQRDRIDDALKSALQQKGFTFVSKTSEDDLLLTWHLNMVDKTDVKTYNTSSYGVSAGYSRYNRYAMYNCYNCMNQTDVRVTEYTQGTFIIDMIDPQRNASIWRSVTQSKLKEENIRDQAALDAAAIRVLANFPSVGTGIVAP